jgi:hypothetical protein
VNLESGRCEDADDDLRRAIQIDQSRPGQIDDSGDLAMPHCLLGYVLEAKHRKDEATAGSAEC